MSYRTYNADSDADDEYERSVTASPTLPQTDYESSATDSEPPSSHHTPTTYAHPNGNGSFSVPKGIITQWTATQSADFISSLGLSQYANRFLEEDLSGAGLIEVHQEDLKELGVNSLGHRLTILKSVYDLKKKQNVQIEPDHFVPLSAETTGQDTMPTQDDISRIIRIIKDRDERIQTAEAELRILRDDLSKVSDENRKLREEILPLARMAKNNSQPLPDPEQDRPSSLARKFSTKKLFLGSGPKNPSPTIQEGRISDASTLDPSAAAIAASSHLTASMRDDKSSPGLPQHSPTSPGYSIAPRSRHAADDYHSWATGASNASTIVQDRSRVRGDLTDPPLSGGSEHGSRTPNLGSGSGTPLATPSGIIPTSAPSGLLQTQSMTNLAAAGQNMSSAASIAGSSTGRTEGSNGSSTPVEIFKSFRVSIDDPCYKVLPVALKKYNITADWRQYALYIVHGDQERCLGLNERPLTLFKQLDREGRKPMFMLRRHAQPAEGHVNVLGQGRYNTDGTLSGTMGMGVSGVAGLTAQQLPGGVL